VSELTSLDGKVWRSIRYLVSRPGFLTLEHNAGRRAWYMPPVRLYLVLSVAYFALAAITPLGVRYSCSSCPPETRAAQERQMGEAISGWTPRLVFVLMPVFAAFVLLVTRRRATDAGAEAVPRHYPQHLYFSIHLHAAWFALGFVALASMVAGLGGPAGFIFRLTLMAYAWLYFVIALRRVYGLRVRGAVWRSITVLFLHTIVLSAAVIFIGLAGAGVVFPREGG
jgi:hypothetical protein